jgi:hypothetical protein
VPTPRIPSTPRMRALAVALSILLISLVAAPLVGQAGAQDSPEDLREGLVSAWNGHSWLSEQLAASTPLIGFDDKPNWGVTLDAGIALAAIDNAFETSNPALAEIWEKFVAESDTAVQVGGIDDPGLLAKAILLAVAIGQDPRSLGSDSGPDLVAGLLALEQTAGPDTGLFGSGFALYDGVFRQGLALRALAAVDVTPSSASIDWVLNQQCSDGSWMPYRSDLNTECAFDGDAFVGPDSNSTASALQALATLQVPTAPMDWSAGRTWLLENRNEDGGWGFFPGDATDPNSTASALQALIDTTDRSVYFSAAQALIDFQLPCSSEVDPGAFEVGFAPGFGDLLATTHAVGVLALDGNSSPDETPSADAGLNTPTTACTSVAELAQVDETTTTSSTPTSVDTVPTGGPAATASTGTASDGTVPVALAITG